MCAVVENWESRWWGTDHTDTLGTHRVNTDIKWGTAGETTSPKFPSGWVEPSFQPRCPKLRLWPAVRVDQHHIFRLELPRPCLWLPLGFPCGSADKESTCNAGDLGLICGLGRSPGEAKGYPLQYSNPEKSRTWLNDFHFHSKLFLGISRRKLLFYVLFTFWKFNEYLLCTLYSARHYSRHWGYNSNQN